ncbi:KIN14R, partial [Symbiodinium microadriaticum]
MPVDEAEVGDDQNDELSAQDSSCHTYDGERSAQDDEVSSSSATQENGPLCEGTSTSRTHIGNKTCNRTKKRESGLWSSKSNASFQSPAPTEVGILDHTFQISYSVEVSMLEIYNESVHDLLVPQLNGHPGDTAPSMDIRHDADGSVNVPGLIKEPVSNLEEVMQVFKRGSANR